MITTLKDFLNENYLTNAEEYNSSHPAPTKDDAPMYDVGGVFPDMYTENALKYYGGYDLDDGVVINQIKRVHNKENALVEIYRAVPYLNKDIDKKIKKFNDIVNYFNRWKFLPKEDKLVKSLLDKYKHLHWSDWDETIIKDINQQRDMLLQQKEKPFKINNGDWVTTSKLYAKEHGESNLNNNYKIIKKTVRASQLYTNGDSIFEWAYIV